MNQLEVQIMGQRYLLGCPEGGESRLLEAVARVDDAMCKIRDKGKIKARDRIAVLASLNLAFELTERSSVVTHPAPVTPQDTPTQSMDESEALLLSLLERIDEALDEDGRLL